VIDAQGARSTADRSSTLLKCMTVGVAKVSPASGERTGGLSAMSVMTTNCNPTSAENPRVARALFHDGIARARRARSPGRRYRLSVPGPRPKTDSVPVTL